MVSGGPNLRLGHVAWGKNGQAGLRKAMGEIIPLKVSLKRGKRRAIANFDSEFIPY